MRRARLAAAVFLLGILPATAVAQGEDARPLPKGTVRLSIGADWHHWSDWFGTPNPLSPGLVDGARQPIGTYFGAESLGVSTLTFLAPTQTQVQALTGLNAWLMNVGRAKLTLDASWRNTPIRFEWSPVSRFGVSVNVPLVRARVSAFLALPDSTGGKGNVGFNPALVTPSTYDSFRVQADTALRALAAQAASGPLALRAQAQAMYNSLQPFACTLYSMAKGSATAAGSPCYSATAVSQAIVLPDTGSDAADSITSRLSRGETNYAALAAQYAAAGVTMPQFNAAYALPSNALDSGQIRNLFYNSGFPLAGDSLTDVVRTRLGDVTLGAWLQLVDGPRLRSQVAVSFRLPTGAVDSKDNFIDLATGTQARGIEVALKNDVVASDNLWFHLGGRIGLSSADQLDRRVTPWYLPYAPLSATAAVKRQIGNYYGADFVPNVQLDDAFGFGIGWHWFHQDSTTYSYVDPTDQARIGLPASVLGQATGITRMSVGAGITFSTLARYNQGRARLPYRVTWSYNSTLYGRGGQVPRDGVMQLVIQMYFGNLR